MFFFHFTSKGIQKTSFFETDTSLAFHPMYCRYHVINIYIIADFRPAKLRNPVLYWPREPHITNPWLAALFFLLHLRIDQTRKPTHTGHVHVYVFTQNIAEFLGAKLLYDIVFPSLTHSLTHFNSHSGISNFTIQVSFFMVCTHTFL